MDCREVVSPPWRKINFVKQALIREQEIKQNEITKGIRKYASSGELS